jgi:hypothetical protein
MAIHSQVAKLAESVHFDYIHFFDPNDPNSLFEACVEEITCSLKDIKRNNVIAAVGLTLGIGTLLLAGSVPAMLTVPMLAMCTKFQLLAGFAVPAGLRLLNRSIKKNIAALKELQQSLLEHDLGKRDAPRRTRTGRARTRTAPRRAGTRPARTHRAEL